MEEHDETVARLLQLAGPRPAPPEERSRRVKATFREQWLQTVQARASRRRRLRALAVLASAAVVIVALRPGRKPEAAPSVPGGAPVAAVERVSGRPRLASSLRSELPPLVVGDSLPPGATVETGGEGRAALRLASGVSVRLDHETRLLVVSATVLLLERGALYADSDGFRGPGPALEVRTPLGMARDIGTRFEARITGDSLRVRVREGRVEVGAASPARTAESGEELTLDADGRFATRTVAPYGAHWDWTMEMAPTFELEGRPLGDFLDWVSRETGLKWRFAGRSLAGTASTVILHGTLADVTPLQALAEVLPACDLRYDLDGGTLIVSPARGGLGEGRREAR